MIGFDLGLYLETMVIDQSWTLVCDDRPNGVLEVGPLLLLCRFGDGLSDDCILMRLGCVDGT